MNRYATSQTKEGKPLPEKKLSSITENPRVRPLSSKRKHVQIKLQDKDEYLEISPKAFSLLQKMLELMDNGKSITIVPTEDSLTTQQVALILNVSRPHVVKLLEGGEIPFKMVGAHRRISLNDLREYEKKSQKKEKNNLSF
jgi:excisionase family DNA binding protein